VLPSLDELGIGFVPFSPLGKGFLTGKLPDDSILTVDIYTGGTASERYIPCFNTDAWVPDAGLPVSMTGGKSEVGGGVHAGRWSRVLARWIRVRRVLHAEWELEQRPLDARLEHAVLQRTDRVHGH